MNFWSEFLVLMISLTNTTKFYKSFTAESRVFNSNSINVKSWLIKIPRNIKKIQVLYILPLDVEFNR